ncbi:MAG: CbtA family protein [Acidimicrobiia bacterium]
MPLRFSTLITRALTAGLAVGVLMGAYLFFVVEPVVDEAVALEEELAAASPAADDEEPLFSRDEQTAGGVLAGLVYALVVSTVFGVVFAKVRHRLPGASDLARTTWLALVGFGVFALMPALKYPANPPAVGDPDTVGDRTVLYLACIALSLVAAVALTRLAGVLRRRLDRPTQVLAVTIATVVVYGLVLVLLPGTPDEIAPEVPAALVWDFRIRSLGSLALLWVGLGLGLGWLLERDAAADARAREARAMVRS